MQTPKLPRVFTCKPFWQSSYRHVQMCAKLAKHLEKNSNNLPLMSTNFHSFEVPSVRHRHTFCLFYYTLDPVLGE